VSQTKGQDCSNLALIHHSRYFWQLLMLGKASQ